MFASYVQEFPGSCHNRTENNNIVVATKNTAHENIETSFRNAAVYMFPVPGSVAPPPNGMVPPVPPASQKKIYHLHAVCSI